MAAPPPYWKKKTRPCPFYSQGRCLFSDACNFVHSVKVNNHDYESSALRLDGHTESVGVGGAVGRDEKIPIPAGNVQRYSALVLDSVKDVFAPPYSPARGGLGSRPTSLCRTPSEKRRRVVLMSPPRSPRLSGLLSALEDVIGPDVEEVEITDEEDEGEGDKWDEGNVFEEGEAEAEAESEAERRGQSDDFGLTAEVDGQPAPSTVTLPSASSSRGSTLLAYYEDSPVTFSTDQQTTPLADHTPSLSSPPAVPSNSASQAVSAPAPAALAPSHRLSLRARVPSPIITQHLDPDDNTVTTTVLDNNTLEVHSHQHHYASHHHTHTQAHTHNETHINNLSHNHNHTNTNTTNNIYDDPLAPSRGSRRQSTFELLTSPFASPAHRILSPQLFPTSPVFGALQSQQPGEGAKRPYGDDDVDSLETLESANGESLSLRPSSSSSTSGKDGSDETAASVSVETYETSIELLDNEQKPRPSPRTSPTPSRDSLLEADPGSGDAVVSFAEEPYDPTPRASISRDSLTENRMNKAPPSVYTVAYPAGAFPKHNILCPSSSSFVLQDNTVLDDTPSSVDACECPAETVAECGDPKSGSRPFVHEDSWSESAADIAQEQTNSESPHPASSSSSARESLSYIVSDEDSDPSIYRHSWLKTAPNSVLGHPTLDNHRPSSLASSSRGPSVQITPEEARLAFDTAESSVENIEDAVSPHGTERPSSDFSCTPKPQPTHSVQFSAVELEHALDHLPPLPPPIIRNSVQPNEELPGVDSAHVRTGSASIQDANDVSGADLDEMRPSAVSRRPGGEKSVPTFSGEREEYIQQSTPKREESSVPEALSQYQLAASTASEFEDALEDSERRESSGLRRPVLTTEDSITRPASVSISLLDDDSLESSAIPSYLYDSSSVSFTQDSSHPSAVTTAPSRQAAPPTPEVSATEEVKQQLLSARQEDSSAVLDGLTQEDSSPENVPGQPRDAAMFSLLRSTIVLQNASTQDASSSEREEVEEDKDRVVSNPLRPEAISSPEVAQALVSQIRVNALESPASHSLGSSPSTPPQFPKSEEIAHQPSSEEGPSTVLLDYMEDLPVQPVTEERHNRARPNSDRAPADSLTSSTQELVEESSSTIYAETTLQDSSVRITPSLTSSAGGGTIESPARVFHDPSATTAESSSRSSTITPIVSKRSPISGEELSSVLDELIQEYPSAHSSPVNTSGECANGALSSSVHLDRMSRYSSVHLAPLSMSRARGDLLESPGSLSVGPSPVTPDYGPGHTPGMLIETELDENRAMHGTILERRAKHQSGSPKRLSVVSLTSPTKELRESFPPRFLERTVRPTPSPLYEDSQHSASGSATSSAMSSPRPSWAELQRRAGRSSKVPFGFRQSLLAGQEESSSLARKLASQSSSDGSASRTSSISSLSPTSAFNQRRASRVDVLAGRARSVSPALTGPGPSSYRRSVASHSSSAPSLQIRASHDMPRSASQAEFFSTGTRSDSPVQTGYTGPSSRRASWMRPLRLSQVYSSTSSHFRCSSSLSNDKRLSTTSTHSSQPHVRNASQESIVQNVERSSARSSIISACLDNKNTFILSHDDRTIIADGRSTMPSMESILAGANPTDFSSTEETVHHHYSQSSVSIDQETGSNLDLLSPLSGSMTGLSFDEFSRFQWSESNHNNTNRRVIVTEDIPPEHITPPATYQNTLIPPTSTKAAPANTHTSALCHAIATPRPTLMFAIASDDPAEVERVLASGEARPNDVIGPQSALEFALTNDALVNKTEIVKTLLAFGADPSALPTELRSTHNEQADNRGEEDDVLTALPSEGISMSISKRKKRESVLNPAMKYYLNRATAGPAPTNAALRRSDFRPLARMRFDFVGQDRALEHLYWVLGMHSQQPIGTPLVVLCCGPCGHGKSLLARKFGSLLDVPTHTVNMTVLKTSHDLWQCPSMSPYDPPSDRTLAEFLEANAGKRCVVVLDEIDKNEDERTLWSLLAPWELGRCSIDAGRRHIDVRNVIWLGTSNIGQDLVFEHHAARNDPDTMMSKTEYRELMNTLRPLVTEKLGTSLMSRVTAVLPFVPFTHEEKLAIASEAILALGGETASELEPEEFERLALQCLSEYVETDGARSLYRSVSTHLMEAF